RLTTDYIYDLGMHFRVFYGEFRVTAFGSPDYEIIGVPAELYQSPLADKPAQGAMRTPVLCAPTETTSPLELIECWRRQATAFGWGPNEAEAMVRCIRRERAIIERPVRNRPFDPWRDRDKITTMTDHLLQQQRARFEERRASSGLKSHYRH